MNLDLIRTKLDELTANRSRTKADDIRRMKLVSASRFLSAVWPILAETSDQFATIRPLEIEQDETAGFLDTYGIDGAFVHKSKNIATTYANRTWSTRSNRPLPIGGIILRMSRTTMAYAKDIPIFSTVLKPQTIEDYRYQPKITMYNCQHEVQRILSTLDFAPGETLRPGYQIFSWFEPDAPVGYETCNSCCYMKEATLVETLRCLMEKVSFVNASNGLNFYRNVSRRTGGVIAHKEEMDALKIGLKNLDVYTHDRKERRDGMPEQVDTEFLCLTPEVIRRHCPDGQVTFWSKAG